MIDKKLLEKLYIKNGKSMQEIAAILNCSVNKVAYWMDRYRIDRRSISDAIYRRHNPYGDPFKVKVPKSNADFKLLGIGLGLYWGEGNKANKHSVRLGNTDPALIRMFIKFLIKLFGVKKKDLRFGLQIYSDVDSENVLNYWLTKLNVSASQFYKITVTISGSLGTYRKKSPYGVVTIYYHNKKLRDILLAMLPR